MLHINGKEVLAGTRREDIERNQGNFKLMVDSTESLVARPPEGKGFQMHARACFRRRGQAGVVEVK